MNKNETLTILHQELEKINLHKITVDDLYFLDEDTGEYIKIGEIIPESSKKIIDQLRKRHQSKTKYALMYQKSLESLAAILSANEIKVLMYMVSKMKYENAIYDLTYRIIAKELSMGVKTVSDVVNSLMDHNIIQKIGTSQKKVYFITPSLTWKGAWHRQKYRVSMFDNDTDEA